METKHFDKAALLALVGDEEDSLIELMEIGVVKLGGLAAELTAAIATGDEAQIRKVAHKLNGTGRSLRMDTLRESAEKLEYLRPWNEAEVPELAAAIVAEVDVVRDILRAELG